MKQLGKWMLGAAVMAGTLGLGATSAHAAQVGFGIRIGGGPVAYAPPCPGPGYEWVAGYYSDGYWIPGRWAFVGTGYRDRDDYRVYYRDHDRDWDRDRYRDRDRDWDRGRDRDWDRGRDRDRDRHDNGYHRGWDHDRR
jgi:hypothetical protein